MKYVIIVQIDPQNIYTEFREELEEEMKKSGYKCLESCGSRMAYKDTGKNGMDAFIKNLQKVLQSMPNPERISRVMRIPHAGIGIILDFPEDSILGTFKYRNTPVELRPSSFQNYAEFISYSESSK